MVLASSLVLSTCATFRSKAARRCLKLNGFASSPRLCAPPFFFYDAQEECVFMVTIAAHMQKVHSVPYWTAKHRTC